MPTDIVMPQMGESIFEGTITKWLKKPGDKVQRDEPLFEISTDKVDAEIPAPASGVLQDIKVAEGATVQVNTVVGTISLTAMALLPSPRPLPRPLPQKKKPLQPGRLPPRLSPSRSPRSHNLRPPMTKTTMRAPLRWSAKSRASTTSIWRRYREPDWAGASPSRTSPHFWKALPAPAAAAPPAPAEARCRLSGPGWRFPATWCP